MSTSLQSKGIRIFSAHTNVYASMATEWLASFGGGSRKPWWLQSIKSIYYRSLGDWDMNCLCKPVVICDYVNAAISTHGRGWEIGDDLIITDVDCRLVLQEDRIQKLIKKIEEWRENSISIAVHHFPERERAGMIRGLWYSAGFVYLRGSAGRIFLNLWGNYCKKFLFRQIACDCLIKFPEQEALSLAVEDFRRLFDGEHRIAPVPLAFNCRPPDKSDPSAPFDFCMEPVILHKPASRSMIGVVNHGV